MCFVSQMDLSPCQNLCRPGRRHSTFKGIYPPRAATHIIVNGTEANGALRSQNVILPVHSSHEPVSMFPEAPHPSGYLLYPTDGYKLPLAPYPDSHSQKVIATVDSEESATNTRHNASVFPTAATKYHGLDVPTPGTQHVSFAQSRARTTPVGNAFSPPRREATMLPSHHIGTYGDSHRKAEVLETILNARESELEEQACEIRALRRENKRLATKVETASEHQNDIGGIAAGDTAGRGKEPISEIESLQTRIDLLRQERQELKELLVAKERQMAALEQVDTSAKEASALQLGVQAISMVQDSVELREKLRLAQADNISAQKKIQSLENAVQDTFSKLTEKRQEAAELLEMVSQRDMRVAQVEAYLQHKSKELDQFKIRTAESFKKEAIKKEKLEREVLVAQEQCAAFKENLSARDDRILNLQAEVVRRDTLLRQQEGRIESLKESLESAHCQLQQMIRAAAAKEAYMHRLEAQLRQNDAERQTAYLAEVSRSRSLALDNSLKQDECRTALNFRQEKLLEAKEELSRKAATLERIKRAVASADKPEGDYRVPTALMNSPTSHHHAVQAVSTFTPSGIPQRTLAESLESINANIIVQSENCNDSLACSTFPKTRFLSTNQASTPSLSDYIPVESDEIDVAVSKLLAHPMYRPLSAHICRLSKGTYLLGVNEVQMMLMNSNRESGDGGEVWLQRRTGERQSLRKYLDGLLKGSGTDETPAQVAEQH